MDAITITVICMFAAAAAAIVHDEHMFQLDSYKPLVHLRRSFSIKLRWYIRPAVALLAIPGLILGGDLVWLSAAFALVTLFLCRPRKAKKPLVFTPRVKRLLTTAGIITFALCAIPLVFFRSLVFLTAILPLLCTFVVLLSDRINAPIEKGINRNFINEACDIINSSPNLDVIGITGSFGKTSMKFILGKILSVQYGTLITPHSYNTTLGVVRTIRENLRATHSLFVCEMGARNRGDIKEICDIVHPLHGVITAVGEQHLESFGSIEVIQDTKFELADALPANGKLFVNADSAPALERARNYPGFIAYGTEDPALCRYFAKDIKVSGKGSSFTLVAPDGEIELHTKLIGRHNVINITGAAAVALELGVNHRNLALAVSRLESVPHRLQLLHTARGVIIDDAYNANPEGARAALDTLAAFSEVRILVTPGMVELGEKQYSANKELGSHAAACCDIAVLVGQKQAEPIREGLLEAGFDEKRIIICNDVIDGMNQAEKMTPGEQRVFLLENDLPDNYL